MERIDGVVGNAHADDRFEQLREEHAERGTLERVVLDETERRRSRLRVETDAGTDLGIVVDGPALSAGDVLACEDDRMIVVALEPREVVAVDLPSPSPSLETMALAVELGHHVGNQHWDLAVVDGTVYVPLAADRHIVERVIHDVLPEASCRAETVAAELFVADSGSAGVEGGRVEHDRGHDHGDGDTPHEHGHRHVHTRGDRGHSHDDDQRTHDGHDHTDHPHTLTTMTTDSDGFLAALRLSDSFLPVGSFTASYGIEQYVNEGLIEDADDLQAVLSAYLERVVGPCDTVAVANAHAASEASELEALLAVDERLHAVTVPREFRESSTKAGGQLCELLLSSDGVNGAGLESVPAEQSTGSPTLAPELALELEEHASAYAAAVERGETPGHYAVVFGVLARANGLGRVQACQAQAYSFVVGLLGAAQRLGRFGHTDIQAVLGALLPELETVCDRHADESLEQMGAFAPAAEVMGMRHERAGRRLFMS